MERKDINVFLVDSTVGADWRMIEQHLLRLFVRYLNQSIVFLIKQRGMFVTLFGNLMIFVEVWLLSEKERRESGFC